MGGGISYVQREGQQRQKRLESAISLASTWYCASPWIWVRCERWQRCQGAQWRRTRPWLSCGVRHCHFARLALRKDSVAAWLHCGSCIRNHGKSWRGLLVEVVQERPAHHRGVFPADCAFIRAW